MADEDLLHPDEGTGADEAEHLEEDAGLDDESPIDDVEDERPRGGDLGLTPPD